MIQRFSLVIETTERYKASAEEIRDMLESCLPEVASVKVSDWDEREPAE